MGVGEIAGLIAAIAFAVLAGFMIYPLIRLGKLFDQIAQTVKDTGDHAIPALDESVTARQFLLGPDQDHVTMRTLEGLVNEFNATRRAREAELNSKYAARNE